MPRAEIKTRIRSQGPWVHSGQTAAPGSPSKLPHEARKGQRDLALFGLQNRPPVVFQGSPTMSCCLFCFWFHVQMVRCSQRRNRAVKGRACIPAYWEKSAPEAVCSLQNDTA